MPIKVGLSAKIIEYIREYFDLREDIQPRVPMQLLETLVLIKNIDDILSHYEMNSRTVSVTGTGWFDAYWNPSNVRARLDYITSFRATGNFTVESARLKDESKNTTIEFDSWSASTNRWWPYSLTNKEWIPIWLEPQDKLQIYCGAHTTTGNWTTQVWQFSTITGKQWRPQDNT